MGSPVKIKKRGFVMTGGGAKGFYEAGVIHAFHLTGMEFDVITGSSIGAMNSIVYAEYLFRKRQLPEALRNDALAAVEELDPFVKAFHRTWLLMPNFRIIDDGEDGPLGALKNDLARFNVSLPQLVRLGWWYRDPDRGKLPGPGLWPAFAKLLSELVERLGGGAELLRIIKDHPHGFVSTALRAYLRRFHMEQSLVPPGDDVRLRDAFTGRVTPLLQRHLDGDVATEYDAAAEPIELLRADRTLRDYAAQGITVRLTRANYRTGRLEVSTYLTPEDFVRYMQKQAWRLEVPDPTRIPLGSFRLQMPGNPNAAAAALASGRFPGVFVPYPVQEIYPRSDADNALLYRLMDTWLDDPATVDRLAQAYRTLRDTGVALNRWESLLSTWHKSVRMHGFFPVLTDTYVDGGTIDNTPSNAAVDAIREWGESAGVSRRAIELELFVVYLHAEPGVDPEATGDPSLVDVVSRTLEIQGAAKKSSEAVTVDTINTFGQRGEDLGRVLQLLLETYRPALEGLPAADREAALERMVAGIKELGLRLPRGEADAGILARIAGWADAMIANKLPLRVEKVIVYPQEMPLSTLQFTERLGYTKDNAIKMLTQGCHDTLFALRNHLERPANIIDDQDRRALSLARRWMGVDAWPEKEDEQLKMREAWQCTRTACTFHVRHCSRGASARP